MLVFDPRERCTIAAALEHPYLAVLHAQMEEPLCHATFGFEFEQRSSSSMGSAGGSTGAGSSPAGFKGDVIIPRAELQAMMYGEMVELLTSPNFVRHASLPAGAATASATGHAGSNNSGGGNSTARADGKDDDSKMDD
jgi:serine/threonine protein kinase